MSPPASPLPPANGSTDVPALIAGVRGAVWLSADGEVEDLSHKEAASRINDGARPLVCHGPATAGWLRVEPFPALDLLELFAFVFPARFCLPTPKGLAEALDLAIPGSLEAEAECLMAAADALLDRAGQNANKDISAIAALIERALR